MIELNNIEKKVFGIFKDYDIYLVGGSVRDKLLKLEVHDYDFAINIPPLKTKEILNNLGYKTYEIGIAFGTIEFHLDNDIIQITTFRKNEKYERDNRNPVVEWGETIHEDLARRDFTINALALNKHGKLIDNFLSLKHLEYQILDTPLSSDISFNDDPLRMLRAIRFKNKYNLEYAEQVKKSLEKSSYRLLILPVERIREEFIKILIGTNVEIALTELLNFKLLNYFLPELTVLKNIDQTSIYHSKDVWEHTINVVKNIQYPDYILKIAALFHDIGKPYVKLIVDNNVHFYRHENVSAMITRSLLLRLKFSTNDIEKIEFLVLNHMKPNLYDSLWSDSAIRRFVADVGNNLDYLLELSRADITSHNSEIIKNKLKLLEEFKTRISKCSNCTEIKSPLSGTTIMSLFNLPQGKEVGEIKQILIDGIIKGEVYPSVFSTRQYVEYVLKNKK